LENEYVVDVAFDPCKYATARWLRGKDTNQKRFADRYGYNVALDSAEKYVYLAPNRVNLQLAQERFPDVRFRETSEIY
jgi:peptide chain release factor 3